MIPDGSSLCPEECKLTTTQLILTIQNHYTQVTLKAARETIGLGRQRILSRALVGKSPRDVMTTLSRYILTIEGEARCASDKFEASTTRDCAFPMQPY